MNAAATTVSHAELTADEAAALPPEVRRIYESKAFAELRARRGRFANWLTVIMCSIYYGFILVVAFAPQSLATKVDGVISVGIPVGVAIILAAIVLTGIYVRRANGEFDRLTAEALRSTRQ
jgi:uncharacterized membrane protein (DUF485 family)